MTDPTDGSIESISRNVSSLVGQDICGGTSSAESLSILLVDNEKRLCDDLAALLRLCGYDVVNVYTGEDPLTISDTPSFDVIIIDVVLQDVEGVAVLKKILSLDGSAGALMLSDLESVSHAVDAMNHGAEAFMVKPAHPNDLIVLIERVARVKRLERELSASEARYRELFEGLGEGVFRVDASGTRVSMNQIGAEILGYSSPVRHLGRL